MCEILLRVVDKVCDHDPYKCASLTKSGDVISVLPDGWGWGSAELANPAWRILKLPNVSLELAKTMLAGEKAADPDTVRMMQARAFRLDVSTLPDVDRAWLHDATRTTPTRTFDWSDADFEAMKERKDSLADPNILD